MPRLPADPQRFIRTNTALEAPAMVPEFKLWLASEYVPIWQATEAWLEEQNIDPPYWAFCWPAGQILARWVLDNADKFCGKTVLDLGCGSGVVAIAAARAGAARVLACDLGGLQPSLVAPPQVLQEALFHHALPTADDLRRLGARPWQVDFLAPLMAEVLGG